MLYCDFSYCSRWLKQINGIFDYLLGLQLLHGKLSHILLFSFLGAECGINADVEKHLELGKKLLAAGQLADALSQFHAAVGWYHTLTAQLLS